MKVFRGSRVLSRRHQSSVQIYSNMKVLNYYNARIQSWWWFHDNTLLLWPQMYIYQVFMFVFETNCVLHPKAFYISGFVVWRILKCTWFYANKVTKICEPMYSTPTDICFHSAFTLNRYSQISKSYLYVPNLQYFATWIVSTVTTSNYRNVNPISHINL
jgi:hypothetical protein